MDRNLRASRDAPAPNFFMRSMFAEWLQVCYGKMLLNVDDRTKLNCDSEESNECGHHSGQLTPILAFVGAIYRARN
jgi:hypothetical protein